MFTMYTSSIIIIIIMISSSSSMSAVYHSTYLYPQSLHILFFYQTFKLFIKILSFLLLNLRVENFRTISGYTGTCIRNEISTVLKE